MKQSISCRISISKPVQIRSSIGVSVRRQHSIPDCGHEMTRSRQMSSAYHFRLLPQDQGICTSVEKSNIRKMPTHILNYRDLEESAGQGRTTDQHTAK